MDPRFMLVVLLLGWLTLCRPAGAKLDHDRLELVWYDEFEKDEMDWDKWSAGVGPCNRGDGGNKQGHVEEKAHVGDGGPSITVEEEDLTSRFYTSSKLMTKDRFAFRYGRAEASIKLPSGGQGLWTVFSMSMFSMSVFSMSMFSMSMSMLMQTYADDKWAASGEIDILEGRDRFKEVKNNLYFEGAHPNNMKTLDGKCNVKFEEGHLQAFHTYALEWDEEEIIWMMDDKVTCTANQGWATYASAGTSEPKSAPFDQGFFLVLDVAVGGDVEDVGEGDVDDSALPARMKVEWVRVYGTPEQPQDNSTSPHLGNTAGGDGSRTEVMSGEEESDGSTKSHGFGDGEASWYTRDNIAVKDGKLIMKAKVEYHTKMDISRPAKEQGLLKQYHSFEEYVREKRKSHQTLPVPLVVSKNDHILSVPLLTIIGVQKGGTTNLRANLLTHPLVSGMPREIHFFDRDPDEYPQSGHWPGDGLEKDLEPGIAGDLLQEYAKACLKEGMRGHPEISDRNLSTGVVVASAPRYIFFPSTPYRMKMVHPEAKLLVILRDPTERYYSQLRMVMCRDQPEPGFHSIEEWVLGVFHPPGWAKEYLLRADNAYEPYTALCRGESATESDLWECYTTMQSQDPLFRGLYAEQLERWFRVYDSSQILIVDSAEMFANFTSTLERVTMFAGLPTYHFQYTTGYEYHGACNTRKRSGEPDFFAPEGMFERMAREEPLIREWYRPHNERLFRLLGRDLGWNS